MSIRHTLTVLLAALAGCLAAYALPFDEQPTVRWKASATKTAENTFDVVFEGTIQEGFHIYDPSDEFSAPYLTTEDNQSCTLSGGLRSMDPPADYKGSKAYFNKARLVQTVSVTSTPAVFSGTLTWYACEKDACHSPEDFDFSITLSDDVMQAPSEEIAQGSAGDPNQTAITDPESGKSGRTSLWALILEAILWGFAMLLTPCVFPMVPMTISYFLKNGNKARGKFNAALYGLFIVLLYTVPICVIIGLTWLLGGETVTADIFNWLATHWLPNIIFFIVFMVFAASFFGAFEITLPSSLVNKSDSKSDSSGIAGIFFMALTLVLVSFSCTGPIVGSVLIKSTEGEFWSPMVTMLAFSLAFALPFTILALFPSLLKALPKSGGWLGSVKVVLGFIEVALGLKFLSVADQTYHWGILDREIYLAVWIVVFTLLGFYLLGKIRFANDDEVKHIGVGRLALAIIDFTFVVYMIPGMWGAPLKALSGYLPPIETQDFVIWNNPAAATVTSQETAGLSQDGLKLPLGLSGYFSLEEGLEAAKAAGKPLFVDVTGHGCVNCREMESRVWSDPRVLSILSNAYVITALYTDDKTRLDESQWIVTPSGKVLKDLGRKNSYIVRERFSVNAQPNYALLSPEGELLVPIRGYNLDINGFVTFLESGLEKFNELKNK